MAWEHRGRHAYYYRKRRINGRACSEYWGRGEDAELIEEIVAGDPVADQIRHDVDQADREVEAEAQEALEEVESLITTLLSIQFTASGFRMHKGQWRRRRHEA